MVTQKTPFTSHLPAANSLVPSTGSRALQIAITAAAPDRRRIALHVLVLAMS
jgi:hypothetical protein